MEQAFTFFDNVIVVRRNRWHFRDVPQLFRAFLEQSDDPGGDGAGFTWPTAAEALYVRGSLEGVGAYDVDQSGFVRLGNALVDLTEPDGGAGFYYLLRPDCPLGSWQSSPGAEPGRDAALP